MTAPENAVRVRADEVRPGDRLYVEGTYLGEIIDVVRGVNLVGQSGVGLRTETQCYARHNFELVTVVRPEPTVTLTITLPERMVRSQAASALQSASSDSPHRRFVDACTGWVAANPEGGNR